MHSRASVQVAQAFLTVVWADIAPDDAQLAKALDILLGATHDVKPADGVDHDISPLKADWLDLYKQVGARFPDFHVPRVV